MTTDSADSFARPRVAAGVLFFDEQDRVLLVVPSYKDYRDVPGGYLEGATAPCAIASAARRDAGAYPLPVAARQARGGAETFQQAIERVPEGFRPGCYLACEALAHAGAGRPGQAATVGIAALSVAIETGRIVTELARVDNAIAQWDSRAEFRDCLTSTLPNEKDRTPSR